LASGRDREHRIVHRTEHSCVVLNKFPYNNGHLLVAPLLHLAGLDDLPEAVLFDLQLTLRTMIGVLERIMKPDGFNVGLNLGAAAGAGLPGHLHWHIVPRWNGDANFMPVVADTKVIVQSLDSLYDILERELKQPS
jgi:ATP adenylyltransferase